MQFFNVLTVTTLFVAASYASNASATPGPNASATPGPKIIVNKVQVVPHQKLCGEAPKSKIGKKILVKSVQVAYVADKDIKEKERKEKEDEEKRYLEKEKEGDKVEKVDEEILNGLEPIKSDPSPCLNTFQEAHAVAVKMTEQLKIVTSGESKKGFYWESFIRFCEDVAKERPEFYKDHITPLRNVFDEIKDILQGSMEFYVDFKSFDSINWDRVTPLGSRTLVLYLIKLYK